MFVVLFVNIELSIRKDVCKHSGACECKQASQRFRGRGVKECCI